ncbi:MULTISPECIES: Hsp70 family protein [Gordonia]|uniref:Hsp70 family protein n=1 Tax=Gordonia TaxID=2053 RepID=UPI0023F77585|nr:MULTISPECIES: Hsp70 family protein [Gordonia]WGJ85506.1 Hsp70 family protein [Gordonia sp. SMJS1]
MIVGFDFGTTNSLISVVSGDRVIDSLDESGLPYPSVVRYEGEEVIVGREAREALEDVGLGVHGNTVRSPKFLLGQEAVTVGGVERSPIDIVADVIRHVRSESLTRSRRKALGAADRAVVTIPVNMNGPRRAALREAFAQADISIAQFVHEPFAALYGYIRGSDDPQSLVRKLKGRNVLVVDWGGGTLDLTLCRVEPGRIVQLRNGATEDVGGDQFDQVIRDEVVGRFAVRHGIEDTDVPTPEARLRLLQSAERNKIDLSYRQVVTFYTPGYFPQSDTALEYSLSRTELDEITRRLVESGIGKIDSLLESVGVAPGQISLCLVAGGMAAMPSIRSSLHEMFGPERVVIPKNSATLVSQGAAWIAHDSQTLVLAKQIELEMARGSRLPLLRAGTPMPSDGDVRHERFDLYCTDPTDGTAKFSIVTPTAIADQPQASDPRTFLGTTTVKVDTAAPPLVERLNLNVEIDDDLILHVNAFSTQRADRSKASYFDLEFGIALPNDDNTDPVDKTDQPADPPKGGLVVRANVAAEKDDDLIPGDVLYKSKPHAFARMPGRYQATEDQRLEHLYYKPCAVCKRQWGDPACRCATAS